MRIDPEDLRRHYARLSDAEILNLNRAELIEVARTIYDAEVARRGLQRQPKQQSSYLPDEPGDAPVESDFSDFATDGGPPPDWLEDASCAHSIAMFPGAASGADAEEVRGVLRAAGIPSYVTVKPPPDPDRPRAPEPGECCVMVPGELNLHAASVIEREIFNPLHEADWRTHLETLSDKQLRRLKPEVFCGALLDKAERLKRAYRDELARRKLQ